MKNSQNSNLPLFEAEAPGWESSTLSIPDILLLAVISSVLFTMIGIFQVYDAIFRNDRLTSKDFNLKVVHRKKS